MIFDIRNYGAVGDGKTMDTAAIQAAIDACAEAGGGQVWVEGGVYLTCPIRLKSYVELHIEANATILGSPDYRDYHNWDDLETVDGSKFARNLSSCLIFAENCHHIAITGMGTIDANGTNFVKPKGNPEDRWKRYVRINLLTPPRVVLLASCRKVRVENVSLVNSPAGWSYFLHNCTDVCMKGLTIDTDLGYPNNDGIHINCCADVTVSDCNIKASDDAIIVRANNYMNLGENRVCERISVTNCNLISHCGAVRLGWLKDGVIRDCTFSNLSVVNTRNVVLVTFPWRGPDRIPDEGREKTLIENIQFDNIVADRIYGHPIRMYVDDHEGNHAEVEAVRKLYFRGLRVRGLMWPSIEGRPDCKFEDMEFSDCVFEKEERTPDYDPYVTCFNPERPEPFGEKLFENVKRLRLLNTVFTEK